MDDELDDESEEALNEEGFAPSESTELWVGSASAWASRESRSDRLMKSSSCWREDGAARVVVASVGNV